MRAWLALVVPTALSIVPACASNEGDGDATSASIVARARTYLVPVDARAQRACRDELNAYYCDEAEARSAVAKCIAKIGARRPFDACRDASDPRCVRLETTSEACVGTSAPIYPTAASCETPQPENCSFYSACLENASPCGDGGYALGYGEKYCQKFANISLSPDGLRWRDATMLCLQRELAAQYDFDHASSCKEITDFAFDSHPRCYTQEENSFCELSPRDLTVVFRVLEPVDLLSVRSVKQMASVAKICTTRLAGQAKEPSRIADRELLEKLAFWEAKSAELEARSKE